MEQPNFELPWMLDPDRRDVPGARPRLDNVNLFLLLLRESFMDGSISRAENKLMGQFAKALKIDPKKARQLGKLCKTEVVHGKLQGQGEADLRDVFAKACYFAAADGEVDEGERSLLASFGRGIDIPEAELDVMLEDAKAQVAKEGGAPTGADEAPAEPPAPEPPADSEEATPEAAAAPAAPEAEEGAAAEPEAPPRGDGLHLDIEIPDFTLQFGDL
jgi:hypothetical protein